ncbi:hypothetical protein ACWN8V_07745 [Vagococcus elongatus]|uniref:Uncharacterized protein n=1 Tax=Vagococcus elongatus TaxID=180344 RepID=A0A430AU24_9ENTE|nr:hypothetical protein [Vagococcus elongatus]RSU11550.1 hypothetical protein CBF29_07665 [Vagococcus elongatus]
MTDTGKIIKEYEQKEIDLINNLNGELISIIHLWQFIENSTYRLVDKKDAYEKCERNSQSLLAYEASVLAEPLSALAFEINLKIKHCKEIVDQFDKVRCEH